MSWHKLLPLRILFTTSLIWGTPVLGADGSPSLTKLNIEDLLEIRIESVSKFEQRVIEAPASVSIITSDDIKKYGYRNLAEILNGVRGLFLRYDRNYHYLGIRGFARPGDFNTRFLLIIDGHRMNDNILEQGAIGNDFILDVDLIDRVEVIRGPSSSLYGTNAFLGIVNVKTKTGESVKGAEISGQGGRFSSYKGRLTYGNKFSNGLELLVSGSRYGSQGDDRLFYKEFNDPATNFGIAKDADGESYGNIFARASYGDFTLQGGYIKRKKTIPTASYETVFNVNDTQTTDARAYLDLNYQHRFANDVGFKAQLYFDHSKQRGDYIYDYADPGDPPFIVKNVDVLRSDAVGGQWQLSKTFFSRHLFLLGGEYRSVFAQNLHNSDIDVYLNKRTGSQVWAVYLQDEFELLKDVRLTAGIRYDRYSTFGGTVNPRVGVVYKPFDRTIFKLMYGQAFRAPSATELYYNDGGVSWKPSSGLKPETIRTVELSLQQYLGFNLWGSAHVYYQRIKDLITFQLDPSDGLLVYGNTKGAEQKGLELELEGRWQNGVRGRVSYALQETDDLESHTRVVNSPTHLVKINGVVPLIGEQLYLGVEEQFTSRRKTLAGNDAREFFITNVTLFNENWVKGLELSASVRNLFGRKYSDPGGSEHLQDKIQQNGRDFWFKLTYRF